MNLLSHLSPNSILASRVQLSSIILISLLADAHVVANDHIVATKTTTDVMDSLKLFGDSDAIAEHLAELARREQVKFMDELIVLGEVIEGEPVLFCNQGKIVDCTAQFDKLSKLYKNYHTYAKKNGRGSIAYQCGSRLSTLRDKPLSKFTPDDVRTLFTCIYEVIFQSPHPRLTGKESGLLNNLAKSLGAEKVAEMMFHYFYNYEKYGQSTSVALFNFNKAKILLNIEGNPVNLGVKSKGRERI